MASASLPGSYKSLQKLQQMPAVDYVCKTSSYAYDCVKNLNFITFYWFVVIEKTTSLVCDRISPVLHLFEKPISIVDDYSAVLIDKVNDKMPGLLDSSQKVYKSTKTHILSNRAVQFSLNATEHSLSMLERVVTVLPGTQVAEGINTSNESSSTVHLSTFYQMYMVAVFPLKFTGKFIHQRRTTLKSLQDVSEVDYQQDLAVQKKVESKGVKTIRKLTLLERLLELPVRGLHAIGLLAQKRAALKMMADPEIDDNTKQREKERLMNDDDLSCDDLGLSSDDDDDDVDGDEIADETSYLSANASLQKLAQNSMTAITQA